MLKHSIWFIRLVEQVDKLSNFDGRNLPLLAKHLALPPNDPHMYVYATLAVQYYYDDGSIGVTDFATVGQEYIEEVLIPVICSLSL
ncbi:hypothetical protein EON65_11740 [archaeon]|nr:MAG: hypothetical protein EON65_11740 [archaeon]